MPPKRKQEGEYSDNANTRKERARKEKAARIPSQEKFEKLRTKFYTSVSRKRAAL